MLIPTSLQFNTDGRTFWRKFGAAPALRRARANSSLILQLEMVRLDVLQTSLSYLPLYLFLSLLYRSILGGEWLISFARSLLLILLLSQGVDLHYWCDESFTRALLRAELTLRPLQGNEGSPMVRSRRHHDQGRQPRDHHDPGAESRPQLPLGHASVVEQVLLHGRLHRGLYVHARHLQGDGFLARSVDSRQPRSRRIWRNESRSVALHLRSLYVILPRRFALLGAR